MKKLLSLLILAALVLSGLAGCSSGKSEEQLKEEIKAQLKAEMAQEQAKANAKGEAGSNSGQADAKEAQEAPKGPPADVGDKDALFRFVNYYIAPDIAINNFDECEIVYADLTGNGSDEAVIVSPNVNWFKNVEIISGDNGKFERVPSDIPLAKYETMASFEDGFLAVVGITGGSGEQMAIMDLYIYDGSKMLKVLEGLDVEHRVAFPNADFEETGEIEGSLKDFTYTLTKHDNRTGKDSVTKKVRYTYNSNNMTFDEQPVTEGQGSSAQITSSADGKVYLSQLKNGDSVGGGLVIRDIDYRKGGDKARFILAGTAVLEGRLYYDDMFGSIMFDNLTNTNGLSTIMIEFPDNFTSEYVPGTLLDFRNPDAVLKALSQSELTAIKNGQPKSLRIRVKDIEYSGAYQSEWGSSGEFISIEN